MLPLGGKPCAAFGTRSWLFRKSSVCARTLFLILALVTLLANAAAAQVESNLRVAEDLLREAVLPLLDSLRVSRSEPLVLRVVPENREESWFVQTRLLRDLQAAGYQNVLVDEAGARAGARLSLRVDRLRVQFKPLEVRTQLARTVELRLSGMLASADGRTAWAGVLQRARVDTVARSDVPRLSESPYEFTYASASDQRSGLRGVLESVALAGALGLITYLFYSYRTR